MRPPIILADSSIVIGSGDAAQIRLKSLSVSKAHALLLVDGGTAYVRDLASRTELFVNDQPVRNAVLKNGDVVRVGKFGFGVVENAAPAIVSPQAPAPTVVFRVTGESYDRRVPEPVVLIGRRVRCDLSLGDESLSGVHAVLFRLGGRWYARDLASRTGTAVNGVPVRQQKPLEEGDLIRVGRKEVRFLGEEIIGGQRVESIGEDVLPPVSRVAGAGAVSPSVPRETAADIAPRTMRGNLAGPEVGTVPPRTLGDEVGTPPAQVAVAEARVASSREDPPVPPSGTSSVHPFAVGRQVGVVVEGLATWDPVAPVARTASPNEVTPQRDEAVAADEVGGPGGVVPVPVTEARDVPLPPIEAELERHVSTPPAATRPPATEPEVAPPATRAPVETGREQWADVEPAEQRATDREEAAAPPATKSTGNAAGAAGVEFHMDPDSHPELPRGREPQVDAKVSDEEWEQAVTVWSFEDLLKRGSEDGDGGAAEAPAPPDRLFWLAVGVGVASLAVVAGLLVYALR
jgi:pSer/pThr/pTyr-binding forkhead associated (FHA) protein